MPKVQASKGQDNTTNPMAKPSDDFKENESSQRPLFFLILGISLSPVLLLMVLVPLLCTYLPLYYNVDSASVSLIGGDKPPNDSHIVTAQWKLHLSIRNANWYFYQGSHPVDVWILCFNQTSKTRVRGIKLINKRATANATIDMLLPRDELPESTQGHVLKCSVVFRTLDGFEGYDIVGYQLLTMRFMSDNGREGVMLDTGRETCPIMLASPDALRPIN